jgi:cytochrome c-type biogenesis protein CcmH/NrfG
LGVLYNNENNLDSAINAYENAVRFKTNFSTAYAGLGEIYLQKNQLKNALAQFEKAVEFGGMNIRYANNLGRTYFQMGNDQKAGSYASFVLQNDLSNRRANYIMAQILLRNGRKKEAQKYMQRAQGR